MYNHRNVDHSGISDAQKSTNFTATQIATVLRYCYSIKKQKITWTMHYNPVEQTLSMNVSLELKLTLKTILHRISFQHKGDPST